MRLSSTGGPSNATPYAYTPTPIKSPNVGFASIAAPQNSAALMIQGAAVGDRSMSSRTVSQPTGQRESVSPAQMLQNLGTQIKTTKEAMEKAVASDPNKAVALGYELRDLKRELERLENFVPPPPSYEYEEEKSQGDEIPPPPPETLPSHLVSSDFFSTSFFDRVSSVPPPPPEEDDDIPPPPPPEPTYTGSVPLPPPPEGYGSDTIKRPTPKISLPTPPNMPLPAIPDEDDLPPPPARAS